MPQVGVYILRGSRFYVGSTTDLQRRLEEHRRGQTHTTKRIGDWDLELFIPCENLESARDLELVIKRTRNVGRWIEQ